MQLAVSRGKFLSFEKERVVKERQGVKHVEVVLIFMKLIRQQLNQMQLC